MEPEPTSQNGNTAIVAAATGVLVLLLIAIGGILIAKHQKQTTQPSMPSTMASPMASATASPTATLAPQNASDSQIDQNIQSLDQKMTKLNSAVNDSQAVPTEPPESQ